MVDSAGGIGLAGLGATDDDGLEDAPGSAPVEIKPATTPIIAQKPVTLGDLAPIETVSDFDLNLFQAHEDLIKERTSLGEGIKAAVDIESVTQDLMFLGSEDHIPNPNFRYSKELWKEMTDGIDPAFHDVFEEAVSEAHARTLRSKTLGLMESERILSGFGFGGTGLRILAAILDPAAIGLSIATEGLAAPYIYGAKISRMAMVLRAGLTAAGTNAGLEAFLLTQNPTKDARDLIFAATGGLILGSGISALRRGATSVKLQKGLQDYNNSILVDDIHALGGELSAKGRARLTPRAVALSQPVQSGPGSNVSLSGRAEGSSAGAAQTEGANISQVDDLSPRVDDILSDAQQTGFTAGTVRIPGTERQTRIDWAGIGLSSPHPATRKLFSAMAEDAIGFKADPSRGIEKGFKPTHTADLDTTIYYKTHALPYQQVYQPALKEWGESKGFNWFQRLSPTNRRNFGKEVSDAIEDPNRATNGVHHPAVVRVADRQTKLSTQVADDLNEAGIAGFQNLTPEQKATYFTRKWKYDAVDAANARYDTFHVVAAFKQAILRGSEGMSDEMAQTIAAGLNTRLRNVHLGREASLGRMFNVNSTAALRDVIVEEGILDEKVIDDLIEGLPKPKGTSDGRPNIGKFRIRMDVQYEHSSPKGTISIKQMLDRDAEAVFDTYLRQTAGRIQLAKHIDVRNDADFAKKLDDIRLSKPDVSMSVTQMDRELDIAQLVHDMILGRPSRLLSQPGLLRNRLHSLLLINNFVRVMGSVGFAQLPEIPNAIAQTGFRPFMQHMPALREVFRLTRNMELDGDPSTLTELAMYGGIGHDVHLHQSSIRLDPEDGIVDAEDLLGKATVISNMARRGVSIASGLGPITDISSRMAAQYTAQNITDLAFNATRTLSKIRIRKMGLNDEIAERVYEQIRTHAIVDDAFKFGSRKLNRINLAGWDDLDARDAFVTATVRQTRNLIQQNDVGNLNTFMGGRLGQTLLQFRTFSIVAYPKQLINGFHNSDFRAYMAFIASMFGGTNAYVAQSYLTSFGKDNRRQWLRDRLDPTQIALAGFQRAGFTTLVPGLVDSMGYFGGIDPLFTFRTTNLASDFIMGSPSLSFGANIARSVRGVFLANQKGGRFSQQDFRTVKSLLPFHTLMGIRNVADAISRDLPRRSPNR